MEKAGGREEDGVTWKERDLEKGILGSKEVRWKWFGGDVVWSAGSDVGEGWDVGKGWSGMHGRGAEVRAQG